MTIEEYENVKKEIDIELEKLLNTSAVNWQDVLLNQSIYKMNKFLLKGA